MNRTVLHLVTGCTVVNFLAQIPYYYHQYYSKGHIAPSILGLFLLLFVFGWFLIGMSGLYTHRAFGFFASLSFFVVEFLFYLQTQISQYLTTGRLFLYLLHPADSTLLVVFGIGYLNMAVAAVFIFYLMLHRHSWNSTVLD